MDGSPCYALRGGDAKRGEEREEVLDQTRSEMKRSLSI